MSGDDDLSHLSLLELYREETRTQTQALSERLLALESGEPDSVASSCIARRRARRPRRCRSGCSRSNRASPIPSRWKHACAPRIR
ncbi:hypothetical protein [Burkholderia cenocepacia]|uniref:hypothetical protein n=1 Tax=Burkholderia cenocepacia TaxID=95486 RepID=UPI0035C81054